MDKSPDAFRTISEVAELLETPAHVLRFWESRFLQIRPVKRAGGRRYYRPADVALLSGIRRLLHDEGMTIRGVQKILREQGVRHVQSMGGGEDTGFDPASETAFGAEVIDALALEADPGLEIEVDAAPATAEVVTLSEAMRTRRPPEPAQMALFDADEAPETPAETGAPADEVEAGPLEITALEDAATGGLTGEPVGAEAPDATWHGTGHTAAQSDVLPEAAAADATGDAAALGLPEDTGQQDASWSRPAGDVAFGRPDVAGQVHGASDIEAGDAGVEVLGSFAVPDLPDAFGTTDAIDGPMVGSEPDAPIGEIGGGLDIPAEDAMGTVQDANLGEEPRSPQTPDFSAEIFSVEMAESTVAALPPPLPVQTEVAGDIGVTETTVDQAGDADDGILNIFAADEEAEDTPSGPSDQKGALSDLSSQSLPDGDDAAVQDAALSVGATGDTSSPEEILSGAVAPDAALSDVATEDAAFSEAALSGVVAPDGALSDPALSKATTRDDSSPEAAEVIVAEAALSRATGWDDGPADSVVVEMTASESVFGMAVDDALPGAIPVAPAFAAPGDAVPLAQDGAAGAPPTEADAALSKAAPAAPVGDAVPLASRLRALPRDAACGFEDDYAELADRLEALRNRMAAAARVR